MKSTPKGLRLHIAIFGRRNVGKSSLLNALTRQSVSIVSAQAGTTTDPVEKPMELLPIGPVVFIDTAGIDDVGSLGQARVSRTRKVFERADLGMVVAEAGDWGAFEEALLEGFRQRNIPTLVVFNKCDLNKPEDKLRETLSRKGIPCVETVALQGEGILALRKALIDLAPEELLRSPSLLGDLLAPGDLALFVTPIDMEAPKGRLILPQVQSIRDALDNDAFCMMVKERELATALARLKQPPALVVTDSQAFLKVAADTPPEIPMTSFSILFARFKADLVEMVRGAMAIEGLHSGDRVLVAEACTHHPIGDDIGTVKIPRWITRYVGGRVHFDHVQGRDWPEDLSDYKLVVHCGACVWNRRQMLSRMMNCKAQGVPITNYGVAIATSLGILDRALAPFPAAADLLKNPA